MTIEITKEIKLVTKSHTMTLRASQTGFNGTLLRRAMDQRDNDESMSFSLTFEEARELITAMNAEIPLKQPPQSTRSRDTPPPYDNMEGCGR
jgi:hypothetical protein